MKIYTRTGDCGETSLVGGARVSKACSRVEAYGDVDELISHIGLLRCRVPETDDELRRIEVHLMNASAHLACPGESSRLKSLDSAEEKFLEERIDTMSSTLPPQNAFVLPGGPETSALCHIARAVCRRAERSCVRIEDLQEDDLTAIRYLNRLSDYLFTLSRQICVRSGCKEDFWQP